MQRWKIIGTYLLLGPLTASIVASVFVVLHEQMHIGMLPYIIAMYLIFSSPFSALAALSSGISHTIFSSRVGTAALIGSVCIVGPAAQGAAFLLLGKEMKAIPSAVDIAGFITPPALSAAFVALFVIRRVKTLSERRG